MDTKKAKILLVEDDRIIVDMYRLKFKLEGLNLLTAATADSGRKMIRDEKPDLVLLDIKLDNGQDGFEILKEIKADPITKHISIYLLSNVRAKGNREKGIEMGAEDFLAKTDVLPDEVVKIVKAKLESLK